MKAAWRRRRVAAVRPPDRRRRPRHRHDHRPRPDRLGARHRSEHADRRRRADEPQLAEHRRARAAGPPVAGRSPSDETGRFVSRVLGSTETQWKDIFSKEGRTYRAPVLVLYYGRTHAHCGGNAQSAMGPFYCPADQKIYLDTSFFDQIETRFRGCDVGSKSCQFAQAYVIAHEVGHHVQNQLGILQKSQQSQHAAGSRGRRPTASRCGSSCRPTASPASGRTTRTRACVARASRRSSSRATSRRRCAPRRRSATTRCRSARRATWCPTASPTAPREQRQRWFTAGFRSGQVSSCNTFASAQL